MRYSYMQRAALKGALIILSLGACSGDGEGATQPAVVTGSIGVSLSTGALAVVQGQNRSVTVNTTRLNYTGAIELSSEGVPNGVMIAFAPASLANGISTSVLTVAASAAAAPGVTNLVVTARGNGVSEHTATLVFTVNPPP